ncbi:hypothetical protein NEMBOFW57_000006 [Staphylotrichum longicolle]|uniref:Uncharacterized protein n=1 Tax=Staphylotrichum longicolle TaxID=669026 RepID=A0AAD4HWR1_9PEZI|nr:hypothetical protein NEMBOFW57_000006 [Staphylotrichum longicolle]
MARGDVGLCNVPQYNFDMCRDQIKSQVDKGVKIWTSIPSAGTAQFNDVPPACMNLPVVLSGSCTGEGPRPVPCGSACIQFRGVTDDQMREISSYLRG